MAAMNTSANSDAPAKRRRSEPRSERRGKSKRAANTPDKAAISFIKDLRRDYPQFSFKPGLHENWSPSSNTITFIPKQRFEQLSYGVLHELAHALLGHSTYHNDFELLKLETEAWQLAAKIGRRYKLRIDQNHIQNCLDTYRDWLHRRSTCPTCGMHVLQKDSHSYMCFNCLSVWRVTSGRLVRPYRRSMSKEQ